MKLRTFDLGWLGALALFFLFCKAIDVANGWTAEQPIAYSLNVRSR